MGRNKNTRNIPTKTKLKKDPGIPRLPDLRQKKNVEKERQALRKASPFSIERGQNADPDTPMASEPTLSSLAALAESSQNQLQIDERFADTDPSSSTGDAFNPHLRKHHIRTLYKVVDESDIVLLVMDARDPEGCRSRLVEEEVRRREADGKRLVFVLNKIDLVPRANAEAWLRYLRHTAPTIPFRSSTQQQRNNLSSKTAPALMKLLKAFKSTKSRSSSTKGGAGSMGSITVGVVGYPNVGKSSLINSLRRAKVCAVAAEAGHTKEMQAVQVERGVRILDSPGVVFDDDEPGEREGKEMGVLLRNVVKVEDVRDPIAVVDAILTRTSPSLLNSLYNLPPTSSPTQIPTLEFLTKLALISGKLHKGGTPDILAAARTVITDWNAQKIPYYTSPPAMSEHPSNVPSIIDARAAAKYGLGEGQTVAPGAEDVGSKTLVSEMAPAFDLGGLFTQADAGAFGNGGIGADYEMLDEDLTTTATAPIDEGDEMDSDDPPISAGVKRRRSPSPSLSLNHSSAPYTYPPSTKLSPSSSLPQPQPQPHPTNQNQNQTQHPPTKRARHAQLGPSLTADATTGLAAHNPLNRRALKKDKKRERKAARRAAFAASGGSGMEIDKEEAGEGVGLEFTFLAGPDGVFV